MRAAAFDVYLVRPLPDRLGTAGILLSILFRLGRLLSCGLFAADNALRFHMFILPSDLPTICCFLRAVFRLLAKSIKPGLRLWARNHGRTNFQELNKVLRKQQIKCPIEGNAQFLFESRQFGQVNRAPQPPRAKP